MEAYIERMVEERRELNEKIVKLIAFRYSDKGDELLDDHQRDLLDSQFSAMSYYSNILAKRICNEKIKTGVIAPPSPLRQDRGECFAQPRC